MAKKDDIRAELPNSLELLFNEDMYNTITTAIQQNYNPCRTPTLLTGRSPHYARNQRRAEASFFAYVVTLSKKLLINHPSGMETYFFSIISVSELNIFSLFIADKK
jgi:hypothetical protein